MYGPNDPDLRSNIYQILTPYMSSNRYHKKVTNCIQIDFGLSNIIKIEVRCIVTIFRAITLASHAVAKRRRHSGVKKGDRAAGYGCRITRRDVIRAGAVLL